MGIESVSHDMVCGTVVIHRKALPELLHTIIRREASAVASLPLGFQLLSLLIELFITAEKRGESLEDLITCPVTSYGYGVV